MIKYYNKLFICAVLFFSISIAQPGVARAESPPVDKLATVLPDDVLVFAATSGGDHLKPAFEKSILGRIWYDPGVQTFYQSIKKEVLAKIKQEIPNSNDAKVPDLLFWMPVRVKQKLHPLLLKWKRWRMKVTSPKSKLAHL
jgi:hypothetical protein